LFRLAPRQVESNAARQERPNVVVEIRLRRSWLPRSERVSRSVLLIAEVRLWVPLGDTVSWTR
jgi:hypothetical protein